MAQDDRRKWEGSEVQKCAYSCAEEAAAKCSHSEKNAAV